MGYTHGIEWSESLIEEKIRQVMKALNIERMPTRSEILSVMDDNSLAVKIGKSGGYKKWSEKLGLNKKSSETVLGEEYEDVVFDMLKYKGYNVEHMTTLHPYDLLVNNNIKIDVKVANWYISKDSSFRYHTFNLEKTKHNCDIFICIGLNENKEIHRTMVIPSKFVMGKKQISCGVNSKYNKFIDRWDYVEQYNDFYERIV